MPDMPRHPDAPSKNNVDATYKIFHFLSSRDCGFLKSLHPILNITERPAGPFMTPETLLRPRDLRKADLNKSPELFT